MSSLRAVPGSYDITTWPIHVPIKPGESLESWLTRASYRYGVAPRELFRAADPGWQHLHSQHSQRWPLERLATVLRIDATDLFDARHSHLDTLYSSYIAKYHRKVPRWGPLLSFCPRCLEEDDAWRASWNHPLHFVCARHGLKLNLVCSGCGLGPRTTLTWLGRTVPGWQCPNRVYQRPGSRPRRRAPLCDADLRLQETTEASRSEREVQAWLLDLFDAAWSDPDRLMAAAGWQAPTSEVLEAVLELLSEQLDRRPIRSVHWWRLIEGLRHARRIVTAASPHDAVRRADQQRLLSPTGPYTPIRLTQAVRARHHNPLLVALRLTGMRDQLSATNQLMFRTGSPRPRYPDDASAPAVDAPAAARAGVYGPSLVPQLIWPGTFPDHAAGGDYVRASLSIALAKVGSMMPLRAIAIDLGLPAGIADRVNTWWRRLDEDRHRVVEELDRLYENLLSDPAPFDYQQRRFAGWDREPFLDAARETVETAPCAADGCGPEDLAWHLWSAFTGSVMSPVWEKPPTATAVPDRDVVTHAAWPRLAARLGLGDEPLSWQPP